MGLGITIHKALDYFFCDRCICECELPGRDFPAWWFIQLIDAICPIEYLFKLLPEEEQQKVRRIYFPRSWLDGSKYHNYCEIRT